MRWLQHCGRRNSRCSQLQHFYQFYKAFISILEGGISEPSVPFLHPSSRKDLEERERALQPEKTIADLSWAGGTEDTIIDEKGNVKKQEKKVYDPEKDMSVPAESRKLAKVNRVVREKHETQAGATRDSVVSSMESLYVAALKDGRTIDAEFYKQSILSMYPDWKFKVEEKK